MNVEDVAGEGFASGRTAKQEGKLAIGVGVLGEIVVNDQHVATCFHEILRDAGRRVRSDVGETGRIVAFGRRPRRCNPSRLFREGWPRLSRQRKRAGQWHNRHRAHSVPRWFRMVSRAMAVLPVWRSPRINSRWPRPMGMSASMTLRPVWSGTVTGARSMMGAAGRSMGRRSPVGNGPLPSSGRPSGSMTRPSNPSPTATSMTRPVRSTSSPACRS